MAAACVQRIPTLSREKCSLELEYEQMKDQVRVEQSKLSDFELEERDYESRKKARMKKAQEEGSVVKVRLNVGNWVINQTVRLSLSSFVA